MARPADAVADSVAALWDRSIISPAAWGLLTLYDLVTGAVFILGGHDRVTGPSWVTVRDYFGGHIGVGVALLVSGGLLAAAVFLSRRLTAVAWAAGGLVCLVLAVGFWIAWRTEPPPPPPRFPGDMPPRASLVGIPTYLLIAAFHGINVRLYGRRRPYGPRLTSNGSRPGAAHVPAPATGNRTADAPGSRPGEADGA